MKMPTSIATAHETLALVVKCLVRTNILMGSEKGFVTQGHGCFFETHQNISRQGIRWRRPHVILDATVGVRQGETHGDAHVLVLHEGLFDGICVFFKE